MQTEREDWADLAGPHAIEMTIADPLIHFIHLIWPLDIEWLSALITQRIYYLFLSSDML